MAGQAGGNVESTDAVLTYAMTKKTLALHQEPSGQTWLNIFTEDVQMNLETKQPKHFYYLVCTQRSGMLEYDQQNDLRQIEKTFITEKG